MRIILCQTGVREIQLNGKQLVFMFMTATVAAVVIFLCGVMVGRGVNRRVHRQWPPSPPNPRSTRLDGGAAVSISPTDASSAAPVSSQEDLKELTYAKRLEAPEPLPEPAVEPVSAPVPPSPTEGARPQAVAPAAKAIDPGEPAGNGFVVQVASLNSRGEADTIAKRLSSKGFPSFVTTPGSSGPRLPRPRRQVSDRRDAETVARRSKRKNSSSPGSRAELLPSALSAPCSRSVFPVTATRHLPGLRLFRSCLRSGLARPTGPSRVNPAARALLGMITGLVYFAGTVYWTSSVLAVFGGMPMAWPWSPMLLSRVSGNLSGDAAMVLARLIAPRGRRRSSLPLRRGWRPSISAGFCSGISLGAARQQPGHDAGRRAGRKRARRVRTVGARRVRQRFDRVCVTDHRAVARDCMAATVVLLVGIAAWGSSRVADGSLTREGTPIEWADSGERGAGGQAEPDTADGPAHLYVLLAMTRTRFVVALSS